MDNELRVGLTWVVTAPLDAFAPVTGPMVLTKEILVGPMATPERRLTYQVAGIVHRAGNGDDPLPGVGISVAGSALMAATDGHGRFSLSDIPAGPQTLRVQPPDGASFEHVVQVPSASYDIPVADRATGEGQARRAGRGG
jgi:hypothetical protein